ncbi:MAG: DUF1003 domain-containing protein [Dehalococcoidia bacterium]
MVFVYIHIAWFGIWITGNLLPVAWDEFPFGLLTMVVSLEAIFLSTFVLMTQNRQSAQSDRRAAADLKVDLISEREVTKTLSLIAEIHRALGLGDDDAETEAMRQPTIVEEI